MLFLQPSGDCMPMHDKHGISIIFGAVRKKFCMNYKRNHFET